MTPAASRALALAEQFARHQGEPEPRIGHVLLALLAEEDGRPAGLVREQGIEPSQIGILAGVTASLPGVPGELSPPGAHALFTTLALEARRLAREMCGEAIVASEHLFLAVLYRDPHLRQRLEAIGLDLSRIESRLRPEPIRLDEPLALMETAERMASARIVDASANRAREALRTLEDYCRFVLNDQTLTSELKQLRHDLTEVLASLDRDLLLCARDTLGDVGTELSTVAQTQRLSLAAVAQAACKRLQEALRSLEEYLKLHRADLGKATETLRYRSYTLEKSVLLGQRSRERLANVRLYVLVSVSGCRGSLEWTVREALAGGAQVIQLREKGLSDRELLARARQLRRWTQEAGALFVVNDRPDLAQACGADGVHVGQDDLPVAEVRRLVGPEMLIGSSTHDPAQLRQAILEGVDYVGVGPVFSSRTKEFASLAGLDFVRHAAAATSLPAFAIGGVTLENLPEVLASGVRRVAVGHAICAADDPRSVAARFRHLLDGQS
jgi:thiamine-phosphate pyrophosphorylase